MSIMGKFGSFFCCGRKDKEVEDQLEQKKFGMIKDEDRKIQDSFCCLIFFLFWVGMFVIGGIGLDQGNPKRLIYGTDYKGRICGVDSAVKDEKYIVYPRTNTDALINMRISDPSNFKFYGICQKECPQQEHVVCNDQVDTTSASYSQANMRSCFNGGSPSGVDCSTVKGNCWVIPSDTSSVLFRCLPVYNVSSNTQQTCIFPTNVKNANDPGCIILREDRSGVVERPAHPNPLFEKLNSAQQLWGRYFGDLSRTWWVIVVCAVVLGVLMGLVWLTTLKFCTGLIVWLTIWLTVFVMIALTFFLYYKGGVISSSDIPGVQTAVNGFLSSAGASSTFSQTLSSSTDYQQAYRIAAYIMTALTVIAIVILVAVRKSINIAIDVIKLGADALRAHPLLIAFPISTVMTIFAFMCWWIFVAASLMSAGKITLKDYNDDIQASLNELSNAAGFNDSTTNSSNNIFYSVENKDITRYLLIYHVFGLLWTNQFILGCAVTAIAGVACGWYWSRNENDIDDLKVYEQPKHSIFASTLRVIKYHLGSIAFGSLLIAIIQFIRLIMAYIQRRTKNLQQNNRLVKAILCIVQCLLWCFQKCLEVVTRNAFIYIAMKGVSFCAGGRRAIKLIVDYFRTLAVVNMLCEILMFIGKLLVATTCAFVSFAFIDNAARFQQGGQDEVSSAWLPALVTFIFAYVIASAFFLVYDICVDSILLCYITDMDENFIRNGGKSESDRVPVHVKKSRVESIRSKKRQQLKEEGELDDESSDASPNDKYNSVQVVNPRAAAAAEQ